ncbi:hypothetical protein [Clostridium botulinum]|uniref:hypothetical protein n=1 Tax=Clostridium botulinum TaxID=1491 RepID=UPI0004D00024|nr:hypothetical protein [Clostridium botulinum]AXG97741.1 hypothetical protein AGE31_19295 [Clostridium botulinum]MBY6773627.1 hypothetical protein [Clostridium botulinum]MBY6886053.1 hypothetical protein [Clostridium botulinum]HBJ1682570.1 hypothetical protein [Clostridium botulinum]HBJ2607837.1 hypothetical protein [Clostridium botulinum]
MAVDVKEFEIKYLLSHNTTVHECKCTIPVAKFNKEINEIHAFNIFFLNFNKDVFKNQDTKFELVSVKEI